MLKETEDKIISSTGIPTLIKREGKHTPDEVAFPSIQEQVGFNKDTSKLNLEKIELFPDLLSGFNVIDATVLNADPSYSIKGNVPPTTMVKILNQINKTLKDKHKLHEGLRETFKQSLFLKGSEAFISIPHDVLEAVLGSTVRVKTEADVSSLAEKNTMIKPIENSSKLGFSLTDNLGLLKVSSQVEENLVSESHSELVPTTESGVADIERLFQTISNPEISPQLKLGLGNTVGGEGLHMKVDSNFIVPLRIGDKVVGYLLALTESGGILKDKHFMDLDVDVVSVDGSTGDLKDELEKHKRELGVTQATAPDLEINDDRVYDSLIMDEIRKALSATSMGNLIDIPNMTNVTKVMFDRALKAKQTNLLYIPAEYVTYYMFNERSNGTGKSLIEIVDHLISIRSMLTFAKIRSDIENSLPKVRVDVDIDPKIKNVEAFMTKFIAKHTQSRNKMYKWGGHSVKTSAAWIQSTGVSYNFKSDKVPYTEVNEQDVSGQAGTIDLEFLDGIKNDIFRRFGLTKQMIDDSAESDFASISVLANELSKKEMSSLQKILLIHHSNHSRQVLRIDGEFLEFMKNLVETDYTSIYNSFSDEFKEKLKDSQTTDENIKKFVIKDYISRIHATLPTLRNEDESALKLRFDGYVSSLDDTIDAMVFQVDGIAGKLLNDETKELVEAFKASYKQMLIRRWMNENNYMVEVSDIIRIEDGKVNLEHMNEMLGNLEQLVASLGDMNATIVRIQDKNISNKELDKKTKHPKNSTTEDPEINDGDVNQDKEIDPEEGPTPDEDVKDKKSDTVDKYMDKL